MRRFGLPQLKWITGAVAALGVSALHAGFWLARPGSSLVLVAARAAVLVVAVLAFNEYAFGLVARRDRQLEQERERLYALHRISGSVALLPAVERNLAGSLRILRQVMGADVVAWLEPTAAGSGAVCRALARAEPAAPAAAPPTPGAPDAPGARGQRLGAGDAGEPARRPDPVRAAEEPAGVADGVAPPVPAAEMWRALAQSRVIAVEDAARARPPECAAIPLLEAEGLAAAAAAVAGVHRRVLGAVVVGWRAPHPLSAADREFLENVGHLLGVAAENLRLYRETQRMSALEERERIAREMHDGLAQALTYLKLKAESALAQSRSGGAPLLEAALRAIRQGAVAALGDVRQALLDLKTPADGLEPDLGVRLEQLVRDWSRLNDIGADVELPHVPVELPAESAAQVVRIVQEALANVRKHAEARRVRVRVRQEGGALTVAVADDGRGFDVASAGGDPGHYGLANLHERALAIGGVLSIESQPGCGTEVVLRLPCAGAEALLQAAVGGAGR